MQLSRGFKIFLSVAFLSVLLGAAGFIVYQNQQSQAPEEAEAGSNCCVITGGWNWDCNSCEAGDAKAYLSHCPDNPLEGMCSVSDYCWGNVQTQTGRSGGFHIREECGVYQIDVVAPDGSEIGWCSGYGRSCSGSTGGDAGGDDNSGGTTGGGGDTPVIEEKNLTCHSSMQCNTDADCVDTNQWGNQIRCRNNPNTGYKTCQVDGCPDGKTVDTASAKCYCINDHSCGALCGPDIGLCDDQDPVLPSICMHVQRQCITGNASNQITMCVPRDIAGGSREGPDGTVYTTNFIDCNGQNGWQKVEHLVQKSSSGSIIKQSWSQPEVEALCYYEGAQTTVLPKTAISTNQLAVFAGFFIMLLGTLIFIKNKRDNATAK